MKIRPNIGMTRSSHYIGGPSEVRYYAYGLRIPRWLFRLLYGWMKP